MDTHLTKVKNVTNMLEKMDLMLLEDIIMYYTIQNLPNTKSSKRYIWVESNC
jgi:hypothetical protein